MEEMYHSVVSRSLRLPMTLRSWRSMAAAVCAHS